MIKVSLEFCKVLAPDCAGGDSLEVIFTCTDASATTGTVRLIGAKSAINALSNSNFLLIDGISGATNIATAFGNISVLGTFNAGYNVEENVSITMNVKDCDGWYNLTDDLGKTNAIMTENNNFLMDENGDYIAFI